MTEEQTWLFGLLQLSLMFAIGAFFLERALFQFFQAKVLGKRIAHILEWRIFDLKPWISKALSCWIIFWADYDAFVVIFSQEASSIVTLLLTGFAFSAGSTLWFKLIKSFRKGIENGGIEDILPALKPTAAEGVDEYTMALGAAPAKEAAAPEAFY